MDKTNYSKNSQKSSVILPNTNASNNNIKIREYTDKKEVNKEEDEKEDKTNSNSKNID